MVESGPNVVGIHRDEGSFKVTSMSTAWAPDKGLVREVEEQFTRAIDSYRADPHLVEEHANHEDSIRVGGYSNRTLLELVQNAADAMSGSSTEGADSNSGRVEIVLDLGNETLYCANAGRPFSKKGLVTIAHAHLSGKRGDEIGRFGLGFKSVLAVTTAPQVFSRSVSFEFNSAEAGAAIKSIAPAAKRLPTLRTATIIDPSIEFEADPILSDLSSWAATIVKLPNAKNLDRLRAEIEGFATEFLLFVSSVREVRLRVVGEDGFETIHVSRNLGNDVLKIERPDGSGDEWLVSERMHAPSVQARQEVGEAVSRNEVKVTLAMPIRNSQLRVGRFWSYFPLRDQTSASGLFNAPWSVNDDRTTLLQNQYNTEILQTLSEMFVELVPRLSTSEDPAAHLDFFPARGREATTFGDKFLCAHVPQLSADIALIPDANGSLCRAVDLRPLDLAVATVSETVHQAWIISPNTADDVPHWRCYTSPRRVSRLRQLFAAGVSQDLLDEDRDLKRALETMPKRGLLSWLKEWADGSDTQSSANALKYVIGNTNLPNIKQAKVIPTTDGMRTLDDWREVFLQQEEGVEIEGAVFVDPNFLAEPNVIQILQTAGFRNLDPIAILNARIGNLSADSGDHELSAFWDAVLGVSHRDTLAVIEAHPHTVVKVPTQDGEWAWPRQVLDLGEALGGEHAPMTLDRNRCLPSVAHSLGVVRQPEKDYDFEDEPHFEEYLSSILKRLNSRLGPGERPIERLDFYPGRGAGPFSALFMMRDADASLAAREAWTSGLLAVGESTLDCDDPDTGSNYRVMSPARWAVECAGIVKSSRGHLRPDAVVAPSMLRYCELLPTFRGSSEIAEKLNLPDELKDVPPLVLRDALVADVLPSSISDDVLIEFILAAGRIGFPDVHPPRIPARVGRTLESRSPDAVYTAVTEDQRAYLASRNRPYLAATENESTALAEIVGCRNFSDSFAFSMLVDGLQESELILDVFTGLRGTLSADKVSNATVARAERIAKRVTTEDGVEDQQLQFHLDGVGLVVEGQLDDRKILSIVNEAFDLGLNNADLENVRQVQLEHSLEELRQQAVATETDDDRLELYIGEDDLREALPAGLWQALEAQGLVDASTSVAELYRTVYGSDSIRLLADLFRQAGFTDVPENWAGGVRTISWLRRMGFGAEYAGKRTQHQADEFVVPGAVKLSDLHDFQEEISSKLRAVLTERSDDGRSLKAMVELPTGSGKTRVATETVLRLFMDGELRGPILWIAQSQELCEQAVQTWETVWRGLGDERPLTVGRLWENKTVHEPDTEFSVVVATDAKLDVLLGDVDYEWLSKASAVIIDEAHRAGESQRYTRVLEWLGVAGRGWERPLVGLSATPFKGTSESATVNLARRFGNRKLDALGDNPYRVLADLGVLAKVRHEVLQGTNVSLSKEESEEAIKRRRVTPGVLERIGRDQARLATLVDHIMGLDPEWPVLVFTPSVLSAQVLAATLRYRDIEAASVSGQTGRQERRDLIKGFKDGKIRVLANCDLLIQGFDAPGVRALYIARPTFSPSAYIQMAGRGLRGLANGGKEECLIVDMADNFGDINDILGYREYEKLWQEQTA